MESISNVPLFLLGPDFFPGFNGSLRVFEPRYKQMMNDCILDSKQFGYISAEPKAGELDGWSQPAKMGVLCTVSDYEESGSNLIIDIKSDSVFQVDEIIQPVLHNVMDTERYLSVEPLRVVAVGGVVTLQRQLGEGTLVHQGRVVVTILLSLPLYNLRVLHLLRI